MTESTKLAYIRTFGCQMNVNDSEKIAALLRELGYAGTDDPERADLVVINTCSVRSKAEKKVYDTLGRFKRGRDGRSKPILAVAGCVAQQEGERMLAKVPYLDFVFGTHSIHLLPSLVRAAEQGERIAAVELLEGETRLGLFPQVKTEGGISRFVTVMQGCDNFCSYCIVPHVRGREVSRRSAEVLAEIAQMAAEGVREVTLLGQNVNSYGLKNPGEMDFARLIREAAAIDGIERIRFTTSHPKDISDDLIRCFADIDKLCGHIHLPAQSGNDRILAAMNRGYTRADYLRRIEALRRARPDLAVTGDIIVGFPGETEAEFEETMSLVEEVRYADLFSFMYSPRPETSASRLEERLSREDKQQRLDRLQKRQREITDAYCRSLVGTEQKVLVEGESKRGDQLTGRTGGNRIVNFEGKRELVGRVVEVRISRAYPNSLLGVVAVTAE